MNGLTRKMTLILIAGFGLAALTGCAVTARNIDSGAELAAAAAAPGQTVVFGRFRLVRSGEEANLDGGIVSGTATLKLFHVDGQREITGKVGHGGEFAWALQPGDYRITSIAFSNRGVRAAPETDFNFTVSAGEDAVYIGTVTLEATIDSGYYGVNGVVNSYSVSNDCAADCNRILGRLGLAEGVEQIALLQQGDSLPRIQ